MRCELCRGLPGKHDPDHLEVCSTCMTRVRVALAGMVDMFERHIDGREGPDNSAQRWDLARAVLHDLGVRPGEDGEQGGVDG
jgi:hypothetical protein